ncbi:MAG: pentapeptide repeat-containing protein, partial [Akkermansiaceae bacterium]
TLDQVKMTSVDAAGANFRDASLTEVNFLGAVVSYADFSNTRFIKTSFKSASVRNANFQTARGSTSPSLDVLRDESDYLWNKRTDALMEFLLSLAPIAGLFALFLLIITATMLHQRSPRPRWLWPCLTSYILALLFALLCFTSAMGSYSLLASILPLLAFLAVGPVITLFGCYLGIAKLAHGNKQRDWTAIFFFASAWLPPIAALAIMLQIIASAG